MCLWLTRDEKHDSCGKGTTESLKGRKMGKWEDACHDARKARHSRQDHECSCGIPVCWGNRRETIIKQQSRRACSFSSHPSQFLSLFAWFFSFDLWRTVPAESPWTNQSTAPVISDAILLDQGYNFGVPVQNTTVQGSDNTNQKYGALHGKKNKALPSTG